MKTSVPPSETRPVPEAPPQAPDDPLLSALESAAAAAADPVVRAWLAALASPSATAASNQK